MKLGIYIMAPELISTSYVINPAHQFVCLGIENVTTTMNTHKIRYMSYQKKVDYFFLELLI
jgi:hypothetical protein